MNAAVMRERAAVLYGYAAAIDKPTENGEPISAARLLRQCADSLRGAANVIENMKHKVDA